MNPTAVKQPQAPSPDRERERRPIPVKRLYFDSPRDMPGQARAESLTGGKGTGGHKWWEIEFRPWLGAFRVVYHSAGDQATETRYVSREGCSWEPAE